MFPWQSLKMRHIQPFSTKAFKCFTTPVPVQTVSYLCCLVTSALIDWIVPLIWYMNFVVYYLDIEIYMEHLLDWNIHNGCNKCVQDFSIMPHGIDISNNSSIVSSSVSHQFWSIIFCMFGVWLNLLAAYHLHLMKLLNFTIAWICST